MVWNLLSSVKWNTIGESSIFKQIQGTFSRRVNINAIAENAKRQLFDVEEKTKKALHKDFHFIIYLK